MSTCIICGSDEKIVYKVLNGMKISLCTRHADAKATYDRIEMPLLQWI